MTDAAADLPGSEPPVDEPSPWLWELRRSGHELAEVSSFYDTIVDPDAQNNAHASELALVGWNKRVLEIGCAAGHVTRVLTERGCNVVGVEGDPDAAERARRFAEQVLVGDLDVEEEAQQGVWGKLDGERFDVVLFGDVLEHLRDPLGALRRSMEVLDRDGYVVVSVPNVAHGDVRMALLAGSFRYRPTGLLDATHLRFFTRESVGELLRQAGLQVVEVHRAMTPLFLTEIGVRREDVPAEVVEQIRRDPEAEVYQYVLKAVRDNADVAVQRALRRLEAFEDRAQGDDLRLAAARAEAAAEVEERLGAELAATRAELERLRSTRTFRWSEPLRRPYRIARRLLGR